MELLYKASATRLSVAVILASLLTQKQLLAIERIDDGKSRVYGCRKIDSVRDFVLSECCAA